MNEVVSDAALLKRYAREIKGLQHTLALERNTDRAQEVEQVTHSTLYGQEVLSGQGDQVTHFLYFQKGNRFVRN